LLLRGLLSEYQNIADASEILLVGVSGGAPTGIQI
jgi:hypothetical protein